LAFSTSLRLASTWVRASAASAGRVEGLVLGSGVDQVAQVGGGGAQVLELERTRGVNHGAGMVVGPIKKAVGLLERGGGLKRGQR